MSPARQYRERMLARTTVAAVPAEVGGQPSSRSADVAATQVALRLRHDLQRLHEIRSIERKVDAKREMLSEYRPWVEGILAADAGVPEGAAADVVPTVMVWLIDTAAYAEALPIAAFVLRHQVAMPSRYNRDAATIVLELVAEAALKAQAAGERFPLETLAAIEELTAHADMHDEARAKLAKAIGVEQMELGAEFDGQAQRVAFEAALGSLRRAQALHERVGVKDRIKRLEKALPASPAAIEPAAPAA